MKIKRLTFTTPLLLISLFFNYSVFAGINPVDPKIWNQLAVRKVLHTFAYGGFATDQQIKTWADMLPQDAIVEMLTFDPVNLKLSPAEDATNLYADSLESLQDFWGSDFADNPMPLNKRRFYNLLNTMPDGTTRALSIPNLQRTWTQSVTTHGLNPFLHRVGFYLTNYQMAISIRNTRSALMRDFYDNVIAGLSQDRPLFEILAEGASSAALAHSYNHKNNVILYNGKFRGNDDFAREFHQLVFKILGEGEDPLYHENTTIEHTAWTLTGMNVDLIDGAYGSDASTGIADYFVAPILFTDHQDGWVYANGYARTLNNFSRHYQGCLEILRSTVCGSTAEEKIYNLATIAGYTDESLRNMPVAIIDHFADDNLTVDKKDNIEKLWRLTEPKSLLSFLRAYAISGLFLNINTVKYQSSFARNLTVLNNNTISNEENFARTTGSGNVLPVGRQMKLEGAEPFIPAHDVFGGQTGLQAANNPNIWKDSYVRNVTNSNFLVATRASYQAADGTSAEWVKDWASKLPASNSARGAYPVKYVAEWLWQRFTTDKDNFGLHEQSQVYALLATGTDFGYAANPADANRSYTTWELQEDEVIKNIMGDLKSSLVLLDSADPIEREEANRRIGLAVNFISATPFVFAIQGGN